MGAVSYSQISLSVSAINTGFHDGFPCSLWTCKGEGKIRDIEYGRRVVQSNIFIC